MKFPLFREDGGRLHRNGEVWSVDGGCTTIRASVPCTRCQAGACCAVFGGSSVGGFSLPAAAELVLPATPGLTVGEPVQLSVSGSKLAGLAASLFGPMLAVAVGLIVLSKLSSSVMVLVGAGIFASALAIVAGRWLAIGQLETLDLAVASGLPESVVRITDACKGRPQGGVDSSYQ